MWTAATGSVERSETSANTENRCPANTDELIGLAPDSGVEEANAVAAAKDAAEDWRRTTAPQRGAYPTARSLVGREHDRLAEALAREEGKLFRGQRRGWQDHSVRRVRCRVCRRMTGITSRANFQGRSR